MPTMKVGIAGGVLLTTMILTVLAGSYPHDVPHQVTVPGGCTVTFGPIRRIGVLTAVSAPVTGDQYGKPRPTPTLVHVRSVREQVQRESDHRDSPYATTIYDAYGDYSGTPEDVSLGTVWGPDHDDLLQPSVQPGPVYVYASAADIDSTSYVLACGHFQIETGTVTTLFGVVAMQIGCAGVDPAAPEPTVDPPEVFPDTDAPRGPVPQYVDPRPAYQAGRACPPR